MSKVTAEFLECQKTGIFTRIKPVQRCRVGDQVGNDRGNGYLSCQMMGKNYSMHRLAWLYVYGEMPNGEIDHVNGDATDNRIANLRLATSSQNSANKASKGGPLGLRGITKHGSSFEAKIKINRKSHYLGRYSCPVAAHLAYVVAADNKFGEFASQRKLCTDQSA